MLEFSLEFKKLILADDIIKIIHKLFDCNTNTENSRSLKSNIKKIYSDNETFYEYFNSEIKIKKMEYFNSKIRNDIIINKDNLNEIINDLLFNFNFIEKSYSNFNKELIQTINKKADEIITAQEELLQIKNKNKMNIKSKLIYFKNNLDMNKKFEKTKDYDYENYEKNISTEFFKTSFENLKLINNYHFYEAFLFGKICLKIRKDFKPTEEYKSFDYYISTLDFISESEIHKYINIYNFFEKYQKFKFIANIKLSDFKDHIGKFEKFLENKENKKYSDFWKQI
jgi:hypothetical protein